MSEVTVSLDCYQYGPGETITGQAKCYFRSSKEFRKIRIRLQGNEYTHWTTTESYYDQTAKKNKTRTVSRTGNRDFILRDDIVRGEGSLPSGQHVFPITFTLPTDLPSTYSCYYGRITYTIKLTVDRAFKSDFEDMKPFEVFSPVRLQDLGPITLSDEKTVCCWCCARGNVDMQVTMESQGFVVGQTGNVKIYCLNMSNTNVEDIKLELKQKFTYKTTVPSSDYKYDSELVTSSHNSGVGAHGEKTFSVALEIPPTTTVPNFTLCELFKCHYQLQISAVLSGCHTDLDIYTPVSVGHIPNPNYPIPNFQQRAPTFHEYVDADRVLMPMPTPREGYGINTPTPYPPSSSYLPLNPSAPITDGAPSAPPGFDIATANLGMEKSKMESPPPSYDEVTKGFPPPKTTKES